MWNYGTLAPQIKRYVFTERCKNNKNRMKSDLKPVHGLKKTPKSLKIWKQSSNWCRQLAGQNEHRTVFAEDWTCSRPTYFYLYTDSDIPSGFGQLRS